MKKKMKKFGKSIALLLIVSGISTASIFMNSCVHQPYVLPVNMRTGDASICFERDVLPIFQSNCAKSGCHDAGAHKGGYALDNHADVGKKRDSARQSGSEQNMGIGEHENIWCRIYAGGWPSAFGG